MSVHFGVGGMTNLSKCVKLKSNAKQKQCNVCAKINDVFTAILDLKTYFFRKVQCQYLGILNSVKCYWIGTSNIYSDCFGSIV